MTATRSLYHYTCRDHGVAGIGKRDGWIATNPQPMLEDHHAVWLTDLEDPDPVRLGLTSVHLSCDRTAARYAVADLETVLPWREWAEQLHIDRSLRSALELGHKDGARHWFVSSSPIWGVRA